MVPIKKKKKISQQLILVCRYLRMQSRECAVRTHFVPELMAVGGSSCPKQSKACLNWQTTCLEEMEEDRGETLPGCPGVRIPVSTAGRAWVPCLVREGRYQCLISWYFSVPQLCRALGDPWSAARQASLSLTISQSWLKLTSIQLVMPSNHLLTSVVHSPPALNLSQHRGLF